MFATRDRQGMGVTGGTPMGFDVGAVGPGGTLKGLDLVIKFRTSSSADAQARAT